jgi:hypothetical protein
VFFVAAGNSFWLHRPVFLLWQGKVVGVTSLPTIPVVPLCQFFGCGGKKFLGYSVSKKDSYTVSLIERRTASKCVYFVRSNTLLLCVFLLSIYLLYQKDQLFLSAFWEQIYQIPMLYPRKLCKFLETIVCEPVEFSGKHSFTLYPSLDPY